MKINNIGFSKITPEKQKHFFKIISTHIKCTENILKKYKNANWLNKRYYYFDINSGSGVIEGEKGSPLIFLDIAKKYTNLFFDIILIEKNLSNYYRLIENLKEYYQYKNLEITPLFGDHYKLLPKYFIPSKSYKYGLIYADNNGLPSFDLLSQMSHISCYQKLDILMNIPITAIKRMKGWKFRKEKDLVERIKSFNKRNWLIRELYGQWQWTFLIATNWIDFPEFQRIKLYNIETSIGGDILMNANYSKKELEEFKNVY